MAGNIFMKARPKKGLLCLFPHDYPYKSQVRSLSYIKQTENRRKKKKKQERENRSVRHRPSSHPQTLSSKTHVWDMEDEDPFPKSKRRQRMERIWAQDNNMNPHAAGMEVKNVLP